MESETSARTDVDNKREISAADKVWSECLTIIRNNVNSQSYKTWFEPIAPINFDGNQLVVRVPSQFFYEWLEEHYYSLISKSLTDIVGTTIKLIYTIEPEKSITFEENRPVQVPTIPSVSQSQTITSINNVHQLPPFQSYLNPRYLFDNFIKGDSNQLARAAALAVANNPGGTSFNPLMIYGGVGLGKTHLIQAIGNHALINKKAQRTIYVSSEKFTIEFVDAIQSDKISEFSNFYRSMDLLIVDDIQFFTGKEKTQDSFFHTFNALHQLGKQIILSSDRPPKELKGLDERLISRFQWGLTADIQPPDLETRIAILKRKSEDDGIELPQDVIEFIAINVTSNIRELEGCLISLLAKSSLENKEINIDLARDVLKIVVGEIKTHISIEEIQRVVCEYYDIAEDLIRAKTRKQEIVNARQIAMYLSKELTNSSLKTIGLHFGGRDHSTVIHAYQTVEDQMAGDVKFRTHIQQIKKKIELVGR
ncbi:MAG: chromosomal replication initiator protein DnaA [Bacteroidota bacterium]